VVEEAWPDLRGADELHDLLLDLGALPEAEGAPWADYLGELIAAGRAARLRDGQRVFWVAAERRSLAATVWPRARFEPDVTEPPARRAPAWTDREGALAEVVRARLGLVGPTTASAIATALGVEPGEVDAALAAIEAEGGVARRLVGLQLEEPGIPRHSCAVWRDGTRVGTVTSGTKSPTLGTFIGMAYVDAGSTSPGTAVAVEIRDRRLSAHVVERPFYRRGAAGASHATA